MSDLFMEAWEPGVPVVLVHGSLATGSDEWQAQRPLADSGFRLIVPDRRGYGRSPAAQGAEHAGGHKKAPDDAGAFELLTKLGSYSDQYLGTAAPPQLKR